MSDNYTHRSIDAQGRLVLHERTADGRDASLPLSGTTFGAPYGAPTVVGTDGTSRSDLRKAPIYVVDRDGNSIIERR